MYTFALNAAAWDFALIIMVGRSCTIQRWERGFGLSAVWKSISIRNSQLKGGISDKEELTYNTNRYLLNKPLRYPVVGVYHNHSYM
jgi:hypothetical protein